MDENTRLKFYCDYNTSNLDENSKKLTVTDYNCSTDEYNENLNIIKEDNILDSLELVDKEEEQFFDLSNIKTLNLSVIICNETFFDKDNLSLK